MSDALLAASDVHLELGGAAVLRGVDFALPRGRLLLLAGRNGSGKTSLLKVLAGLVRPRRGVVRLAGADLAVLPRRQRARELALIPQDSDSPFEFTGRELVLMGRHAHIPRFGAPGAHDLEAVAEALHRADAEAFADRPVTTLSGGERQRIAIARALATQAPILLADEPTANLDLDHALAVLGLLAQHAAAGGAVVVVSHDLNLVAPFAQAVAVLHQGRILCCEAPERALEPERVAAVFGVRSRPADGLFPRLFELP